MIADNLDEARLKRDPKAIRLFISATNVRTGKPRVFSRTEVTTDVILASACLPNVFRAVEIDGEAYWDARLSRQPGDLAAVLRARRARHPARWCRSTPSCGTSCRPRPPTS
ncbi:patatin-like phospholipase family protein [Dankookia sp. P2]|uniref:patatin-like phospholipase family protein n=1 Tax=Dankookia sp. P2 TaxID=3423955 RepID=UPI003D66DB63